MKSKFNLILIFVLITKTFGQTEVIVIYKIKTYEENNENPKHNDIDKNTLEILKKTEAEFGNLKYELIINNELALFTEIKKLDKPKNTHSELAKVLSGYSGEIYVDVNKKLIIEAKDIGGRKFLVEKNLDDYEWEIDVEKVNIRGYDCFKATTTVMIEGRNGQQEVPINAWFTPEINLPYGPSGYCGLPGLIIQIQKGNVITYLSEINFQPNEKKIQLPTDKTINTKEFNEMMKKMNSNRGNY